MGQPIRVSIIYYSTSALHARAGRGMYCSVMQGANCQELGPFDRTGSDWHRTLLRLSFPRGHRDGLPAIDLRPGRVGIRLSLLLARRAMANKVTIAIH